uniref:EGF-like domain-containing protein n=1 Tax=Ascaris lumbricoides TaxID=6252 RepID=A0A9J2P000_ASCLU
MIIILHREWEWVKATVKGAMFALIFYSSSSLLISVDTLECKELSFSAWSTDLGLVHTLQRIAIIAPLSIFYVYIEISDDQSSRKQLHSAGGSPLVIYSSLLPTSVEWQSLDVIARRVFVESVYPSDSDFAPTVMLTACKYDTSISYFNDQAYTVDTDNAGIVSMYENQLSVLFRTFENGIFIFSMADQGDLLIAQIVRGTVHVIFDFGSLTHSTISGGVALNDGEWHEMRWVHQFDSVQLLIDGVVTNTTTPSGLYRKLDFDSQIHIAGRPPDDMSEGIEISFHGCLARIMLNSADLLAKLPSHQRRECQMPRPQLMTITPGAFVEIPFSFLPFSIEFRLLPQPSTILMLSNARNESLLQINVNQKGYLSLTANMSRVEQVSHPAIAVGDGSWHSMSLMIWGARLHVDVNGLTVMWLEGSMVRSIAKELAHFHLSAVGCYRSATVAFRAANIFGNVSLDRCDYKYRCSPNPCENDGICRQVTLTDLKCLCKENYEGRTCHSCSCYSRLPRSCEEFFMQDGKSLVKNVSLDVDGGYALRPFKAQCSLSRDQDSELITTTVFHDLEPSGMFVTGPTDPGTIRKTLRYGLHIDQIDRFIDGFESCEQYMRYQCRGGAKLMTYGYERRPSSWYGTRNGQHGLQWADAPPYSRMCSCAVNSSCIHNRMCNCDSGEDAVDDGYNPHMQLLPVMNLYLGGTSPTSSLNVSIGPLICAQRLVFDAVSFLSRDVRLSGSQTFLSSVFDVALHVRFSHPRMTIFTWESANGQRWFQLYVSGGKLVGQIVNGGSVFEIEGNTQINDNQWHAVYWEVNEDGMLLKVDKAISSINMSIVLPHTYTWIIGSRTQHGLSGFAGMVRNVYLCGKEIALTSLVRKLHGGHSEFVEVGKRGACKSGSCSNGAKCIELYDSYACNCSMTPFTGPKCDQGTDSELETMQYAPVRSKNGHIILMQESDSYANLLVDVGMSVPQGSHLSIPWQHPAHVASCFRIAVQSHSSNYSLIRARALFADSQFNLTINNKGYLEMSVFDGFFFHHKAYDTRHRIDQNEIADIEFCADKKAFDLYINKEASISIQGNWSFFAQLNVWNFLDKSEISLGALRGFRVFPSDDIDSEEEIFAEIQIHAIVEHRNSLMILTPIIAIVTACAILLLILTVVCWIRNRPDGVYKTNENILAYCSPSRSEEPLVINSLNKEYFC